MLFDCCTIKVPTQLNISERVFSVNKNIINLSNTQTKSVHAGRDEWLLKCLFRAFLFCRYHTLLFLLTHIVGEDPGRRLERGSGQTARHVFAWPAPSLPRRHFHPLWFHNIHGFSPLLSHRIWGYETVIQKSCLKKRLRKPFLNPPPADTLLRS